MNVIVCVTAVHPWTKDNLLLVIILIQIQRFCRAHAIIIEPSGHDQRRNTSLSEAFLPVSALPHLVIIHMRDPFMKKRDVISQRLFRKIFQRTYLQHLVPVIPYHLLRRHALAGHRERPCKHTGIEASSPPWHIHKGTSCADTAQHSLQMGIPAGCSRPLDITQIRTSGHRHIPVAPRLACYPVERIISVFYFIIHRKPLSLTVLPPADILNHQGISSLDETIVRFDSSGFSIRRTDKNRRNAPLFPGEIHVCCQSYAVPHRHHISLRFRHPAWFIRIHLFPSWQERPVLISFTDKKSAKIPSRRHKCNNTPVFD